MSFPTTNVAPNLPTNCYEYKIVCATGPSILEDRVTVLMSAGWLPTGGVSVQETLAESWVQSMYRINPALTLLAS